MLPAKTTSQSQHSRGPISSNEYPNTVIIKEIQLQNLCNLLDRKWLYVLHDQVKEKIPVGTSDVTILTPGPDLDWWN